MLYRTELSTELRIFICIAFCKEPPYVTLRLHVAITSSKMQEQKVDTRSKNIVNTQSQEKQFHATWHRSSLHQLHIYM